MSEITWRNELLIDFMPTRDERQLLELYCIYHDLTERFDRSVCSGRDAQGTAMPETSQQRSEINRHAALVMRVISSIRPWRDVRRQDCYIGRWPDREITNIATASPWYGPVQFAVLNEWSKQCAGETCWPVPLGW